MDKSAFGMGGAKPAPAPAHPATPTAIDILRRVEWLGVSNGWACCPLCEGNTTVGHAADCDLAAVLRAHATLAPPAPSL